MRKQVFTAATTQVIKSINLLFWGITHCIRQNYKWIQFKYNSFSLTVSKFLRYKRNKTVQDMHVILRVGPNHTTPLWIIGL